MLNVIEKGTRGPGLVFLHGFGGSAQVWAGQAAFVADAARVIALDLPGHGQSPWNGESLEDMARRAIEIVQSRAPEGAWWCVSSFGGLVALKVWEIAPSLVRGLLLAGSMPRFTAVDGFPAGLDARRIRKLDAQFCSEPPALIMEAFFRSLLTRTERESAGYPAVKALRASVPVPVCEVLSAYLQILEETDLRAEFERFDRPLMFVFGDSDKIATPGALEAMCQMKPDARAVVLKDAGHMMFLTQPGVFNRALMEFIGV
jgi:pimeloyl-[acyl-carrier protein] methyl ester esterase